MIMAPPKSLKSFSPIATSTTSSPPPPDFPARDTCIVHEEGKVVGMKPSFGSAEPSGSCSRKRPLTQLSDSVPGQPRRSSRIRRPFSRLAGTQEHEESSHQSEVKTAIEDVALGNVQAITGEVPLPPHTTGIEGKGVAINANLEPTFLAILEKYGDITRDCCLESGYMLTSVLEIICKVVQDLHNKDLREVDCNLLNSYYLVVRDAEKLKVDVNWLRTRLDEIKDAVESIPLPKSLYDEKNDIVKVIENEKKDLEARKVELEKLESQIAEKESILDLMNENIKGMIKAQELKYNKVQRMPLI